MSWFKLSRLTGLILGEEIMDINGYVFIGLCGNKLWCLTI